MLLSTIALCGAYLCCGIWYIREFYRFIKPRLKEKGDVHRLLSYLGFQAVLIMITFICSAINLTNEEFLFGPWLLDGMGLIMLCINFDKGVKYFYTKCGMKYRTMKEYKEYLMSGNFI